MELYRRSVGKELHAVGVTAERPPGEDFADLESARLQAHNRLGTGS
jgi:hypothetical protein